jgi:hypothetical protein
MDMVAKQVFQYEIEKLQLAYVKGLLSLYYVFRFRPINMWAGPKFIDMKLTVFLIFSDLAVHNVVYS